MWLGIGYTIPQSGDVNTGGGVGPTNFYIVKEADPTIQLETESGSFLMIQEIAP
jgi:hypothetical protein